MLEPTALALEKLPRWAREYINSINSERAELKTLVATLTEPATEITVMRWLKPGYPKTEFALPRYPHVEFRTAKGRLSCFVSEQGVLQLHADRALLVQPVSSNWIEILERDY